MSETKIIEPKKLIVCQGIPASGKSTWAKAWVLEDPLHRVHINMDDIRNMLGKYWVPERESLVLSIQEQAIIEALKQGYDIVIDNTNLKQVLVDKFHTLTLVFEDYEFQIKKFFDTPLSVCIERDKNRENPVGEQVIRNFYNRYKDRYNLNGN